MDDLHLLNLLKKEAKTNSLVDIANKANVSQSSLWKILNNKSKMGIQVSCKLRRYYEKGGLKMANFKVKMKCTVIKEVYLACCTEEQAWDDPWLYVTDETETDMSDWQILDIEEDR